MYATSSMIMEPSDKLFAFNLIKNLYPSPKPFTFDLSPFTSYIYGMKIIPFESVGELLFTDERQELRDKVGGEYQPGVNDFEGFREYYDFFPLSDLLIYYDEADRVNAFEFFSAGPEFKDIDLLAETYGKLIELFTHFDPELVIEDSGFDAPGLGIGVHTPDTEDENDIPESVIIYKRGYYDEE